MYTNSKVYLCRNNGWFLPVAYGDKTKGGGVNCLRSNFEKNWDPRGAQGPGGPWGALWTPGPNGGPGPPAWGCPRHYATGELPAQWVWKVSALGWQSPPPNPQTRTQPLLTMLIIFVYLRGFNLSLGPFFTSVNGIGIPRRRKCRVHRSARQFSLTDQQK